MSSVGPILAVPGIRQALAERRDAVTAVSPIVGGGAVSGPAGKMMLAHGHALTPAGVAGIYEGLLARLVIDRRDADWAPALRDRGIQPIVTDSMMTHHEQEIALARVVLEAFR